MDVDLRSAPPRRWNVAVEQIIWLPRLIDKARAFEAGTLGGYLFGQSPVDDSLLRAGRCTYDDVRAAAGAATDDAGVLANLEHRCPGATQRLRAWSTAPPLHARAIFALVDANEGRATGPARALALVPEPVLSVVVWALRRSRPYA